MFHAFAAQWVACLLLASSYIVAALPNKHRSYQADECPPFNGGNFTINQYQLYPENADFDTRQCLLYIGYVAIAD